MFFSKLKVVEIAIKLKIGGLDNVKVQSRYIFNQIKKIFDQGNRESKHWVVLTYVTHETVNSS